MNVIHEANVCQWEKQGTSTEIAAKFGLKLIQQFFHNPHKDEQVDFSLFTVKDGNQICAVTEEGNLLLVKQYKQGAHDIVWEVPGGVATGVEDPCTVAARELREETGYEAKQIIHTGAFWIHTRKSPSVFNTLLALGCHRVGVQQLDEHEVIEVVEVTPTEFWQMVKCQAFKEPQSLTAVVMAALHGHVPFGI